MTPAVVLIHCFGGSARSFDPVIARLDGLRTHALDLPGFGAEAGASGPYTVDAYADYVEARIQSLAPERYVVVGHSMGGKVALALAARQARGLFALVLLAPSPPTPEPMADEARASLIAGWAEYGTASQILAKITARPLPDALRMLAINDLMRSGKAAWTAWLKAGSREDISDVMASVTVPVTILSGTCDTVLPTALMHSQVADRLADACIRSVPGAGHFLPLEAPAAVAAAITHAATYVIPAEAGISANLLQCNCNPLRSRPSPG